ncbi:MAG: type II and III secretion system protein, partial [Gammaproteobacteria bacterium]|nr:type II and III secretion system protein [Gammaproteobacteria bacterium]
MIIKNSNNRFLKVCLSVMAAALIVSCGATNPPTISEGHIKSKPSETGKIPSPVTQVPALPRPGKREKLETYTVVVNQVPIREL